MKTVAIIAIACLTSCGTTFYGKDGRPEAVFTGDMTRTDYTRGADGSTKWTAESVNHSTPTTAAGNAVSKGVLSIGTSVATGGASQIVK